MNAPSSRVSASLERRATDGLDAEKRPPRDVRALLERLAELHEEVADTFRELLTNELDDSANLSPVGDVETTTKTPAPGPDFLRVQDVAKRLQVDTKTVRRWRDEGKMPPVFANGSVLRWRSDLIDEWIASQEGSK